MEPKALIDDGYTRRSIINGRRNHHPALTFDWRPTPVEKWAFYLDHITGFSKAEETKALAAILESHILTWDKEEEPTAQNILKLHQLLYNDLVQVIVLMEKAPDKELSLSGGLQVKADQQQMSLEEYLAKNSETESTSPK